MKQQHSFGFEIYDDISELSKEDAALMEEARKMVQGGGISINRKKIEAVGFKIDTSFLLHDKYLLVQKGKKNYYLVICL